MEAARRFWDEHRASLVYVGLLLLALVVIYGAMVYVVIPLIQSGPPTEHRFDDGVRCYTRGASISCVVVR